MSARQAQSIGKTVPASRVVNQKGKHQDFRKKPFEPFGIQPVALLKAAQRRRDFQEEMGWYEPASLGHCRGCGPRARVRLLDGAPGNGDGGVHD